MREGGKVGCHQDVAEGQGLAASRETEMGPCGGGTIRPWLNQDHRLEGTKIFSGKFSPLSQSGD